MDYNALIQNRKSARQFTDKKVGEAVCAELESYYQNTCQRLVPGISTELWIFGDNTRQALEGAAAFHELWTDRPLDAADLATLVVPAKKFVLIGVK